MPHRPLPADDLAHITTQARAVLQHLANANLFITGGTGFFGHWLLESLLHANHALNLNITATVLTRNAETFRAHSPHITSDPAITLHEGDIRTFDFPAVKPAHIIHAATESSGQLHQYQIADIILEGTRRTLQFAKQSGTQRLLYISSGAVYGRSTMLAETPETYTGSPDQLQPQSAYDEAKRMAENMCVTHAIHTPLQPVIARCFAFVGPHLPLDHHFAIGNFVNAALCNEPIHISGDGTPRRSWLYMSDLAIWLWTLLALGQPNRAYNVGSDESFTIAEAAALTAQTLRPDGRGSSTLPIHIAQQADLSAAPSSYVPSIARAREELGLTVTVPLAEALRRTARWHGMDI